MPVMLLQLRERWYDYAHDVSIVSEHYAEGVQAQFTTSERYLRTRHLPVCVQ